MLQQPVMTPQRKHPTAQQTNKFCKQSKVLCRPYRTAENTGLLQTQWIWTERGGTYQKHEAMVTANAKTGELLQPGTSALLHEKEN